MVYPLHTLNCGVRRQIYFIYKDNNKIIIRNSGKQSLLLINNVGVSDKNDKTNIS